jgi:hypothetical protein
MALNPFKEKTDRKSAARLASAKHYSKNREEILKRRKEKREKNKDEARDKQRAYRALNKGKDAAASKRYRDRNRKKVLEIYRKYNREHKEKRRAYSQEWRKKNKHKDIEYREKRVRWIPIIDGKKIRNYQYMTKEEAISHPRATNAYKIRKSGI